MIRNMDTSEKYIEMCRAAEEIQKLKPTEADARTWFYCTEHKRFLEYNSELEYQWCGSWNDWHSSDGEERVIWLPRQDQLQDLLNDDLRDIAEGFYDYMTTEGYNYEYPEFNDARCKEFGSMEQLWLAYVMETKYGKQWDGTAWVDPNAEKKSLLSQILDAHTRFQCDHMKPKIIVMSSETWKDLEADLIHYRLHVSTAPSGVESIYGLRVAIDNNFKKGEFQITGVPL